MCVSRGLIALNLASTAILIGGCVQTGIMSRWSSDGQLHLSPTDSDYPVENASASRTVTISGTLPPTLSIELFARYSTTSNAIKCTYTESPISEAGGFPMWLDVPLKIERTTDSYSTSFAVDKYQSRRCGWEFGGISAKISKGPYTYDGGGYLISPFREAESTRYPYIPDSRVVNLVCGIDVPGGTAGFFCKWAGRGEAHHSLHAVDQHVAVNFRDGGVIAPASVIAAWATHFSKQETTGRTIEFRYAEFRQGFRRSRFPDRVILVWKYQSESGMPATQEGEAMHRMEDLLAPLVDQQLSLITAVSTGDNLREWIFYSRSEKEFLAALNRALAGQPSFPIEVHAAPDPDWSTYQRFRSGVRERY